ncbi:MAG TPA: hypothetical protein VKA46_08670 [Gemmataceae bacterium]|nr:hypothetical protein [Gemmataceae bacterium]
MRFPSRTTTVNIPWIVELVATTTLAVVLSPIDGKVLAAPPDSDVEIRAQAGSENSPPQFEWHRGSAVSLAFSPDGKSLIMGWQWPPTAFIWNLTTNKVRHLLPWHESDVVAVAYSPDGEIVATGCGPEWPPKQPGKRDPAKLRLWDPASGKLIREIEAHRGRIQALAFSPDSKRLLSGGRDDAAKIWDVASGKEVRQFVLDSRSDEVVAVAFSPDGKRIALGSGKGEFVLGNVETGHSESRLGWGNFLAADKELFRLEIDRGKEYRGGPVEYVLHSRSLLEVKDEIRWRRAMESGRVDRWAVSPDGKVLALLEGRGFSLWSLETGKQLCLRKPGRGSTPGLFAFSPDGKTLAVVPSENTVQLWDVPRLRLDALWGELALRKDAEAEEFVKAFGELPKEAVPYLAGRLQRLAKLEERVRQLVKGLDDNEFEVREKASRHLQALGPEAEFALERVLKNKPSAEVRKRVEELLATFDNRPAPLPLPVDPKHMTKEQLILWQRGQWPPKPPEAPPRPSEAQALKRAFAALEKIGTPEARQAAKSLAETAPDGLVREQAKASLERLAKSKSPGP